MKQREYILNNEKEVLGFLKSRYPMYHLSNVFFRDVQYGILKMFEQKGERISYPSAEKLAREFVEKLEKVRIFNKIDQQSWVLNYPDFKKPVVVPAPSAKPAPGAAPAKSPAAAGAKPVLPPLGSKPAGAAAAKPALPPLGSAKPVETARAGLPPLSGAKPVGTAKPGLPPLTSAKPAGAMPIGKPATDELSKTAVQDQETSAQAKPPVPEPTPSSPATPAGQKKTLPPLKGNYKPAGK